MHCLRVLRERADHVFLRRLSTELIPSSRRIAARESERVLMFALFHSSAYHHNHPTLIERLDALDAQLDTLAAKGEAKKDL